MKNNIKYILLTSLIASWSFSFADGKITGLSKVKVKPGTHLIEKGSVNIEENAQLIVEGMLTVDANLNNESSYAGIQVLSNAENTGSIIHQNGFPKATVERFMTSGKPHIIGSPVIGETAEVLSFVNPSTFVYEYNDGSGLNIINDLNTELNNGQAYYYKINPSSSGSITPAFEGTLNSEDLQLDQNSIPPLQFNVKGTNFVANPYASSFDWEDENIELFDMEASIWIYDSENRRMKFRNNSGYGNLENGIIPMGQGFYVKTYSEEATLTIPASARRHAQQAYYKQEAEDNEKLSYVRFEVIKNDLADEVWVGYRVNSIDEFDNGIDISKMFTFDEEPQIFTSHHEQEFSIDLIEKPESVNKQIPLFFRAGSNGTHYINLLEYQGFEDMLVQLEDLITGEMIDVDGMDSYTFNANIGDEENRFILHFNPLMPTGNQEFESQEQEVQIYAYADQIYISSSGEYSLQTKIVQFFDLNGKLLGEIPLSDASLSVIKNKFKRKMILVKANYPDRSFVGKVIFVK